MLYYPPPLVLSSSSSSSSSLSLSPSSLSLLLLSLSLLLLSLSFLSSLLSFVMRCIHGVCGDGCAVVVDDQLKRLVRVQGLVVFRVVEHRNAQGCQGDNLRRARPRRQGRVETRQQMRLDRPALHPDHLVRTQMINDDDAGKRGHNMHETRCCAVALAGRHLLNISWFSSPSGALGPR